MSQSEYRLYYHVHGEVMDGVRYTLSEDDEHAIMNFKNMIPESDNMSWINLERFCPYRSNWLLVKCYDVVTTGVK